MKTSGTTAGNRNAGTSRPAKRAISGKARTSKPAGIPAKAAASPTSVTAIINVQIASRARHLPRGTHLRQWARAALGAHADVTVRVVDAREGRSLNRRYRNKDYATNVLSFSYQAGRVTRGDVVLCAAVVCREAREQKKSIDAHFAHMTVHGMLHLRGYDHETAACARVMENRERRILRGLGFCDPYL